MWLLRYAIKVSVLVLLLALVAANAQENETEVFTFPKAGSILPAAADMTITWTPRSPGPVTLVLQGHEIAITIADSIPNSGSYVWRVPENASGTFVLSLVTSRGTATSEPFTVAAGMPAPPPTPTPTRTPKGGAVATALVIVTSTLNNITYTATATKKPPSITDGALVLDVSTPTVAADPTEAPPPLVTTDTVVGGDGSSPPSPALIAGATVAAVAVALISAAAFWLWRRRRMEKLREGEISDGEEQRNREMITRGMGAYPGRQFGGGATAGSLYAASSFGGVASQYAVSFKTGGSLMGMEQYAGTGTSGRDNLDEYGRTKGMVNKF